MSSSLSSSSMGGSLALAAATAVAFSGSLVIFSLCRAHHAHAHAAAEPEGSADHALLRPCLSSEKRRRGGKAKRGSKAEKRVRFAADVVDNEGAPRPTRHPAATSSTCRGAAAAAAEPDERMMMPANREALYRGMLRDRSSHRVTCSY